MRSILVLLVLQLGCKRTEMPEVEVWDKTNPVLGYRPREVVGEWQAENGERMWLNKDGSHAVSMGDWGPEEFGRWFTIQNSLVLCLPPLEAGHLPDRTAVGSAIEQTEEGVRIVSYGRTGEQERSYKKIGDASTHSNERSTEGLPKQYAIEQIAGVWQLGQSQDFIAFPPEGLFVEVEGEESLESIDFDLGRRWCLFEDHLVLSYVESSWDEWPKRFMGMGTYLLIEEKMKDDIALFSEDRSETRRFRKISASIESMKRTSTQ